MFYEKKLIEIEEKINLEEEKEKVVEFIERITNGMEDEGYDVFNRDMIDYVERFIGSAKTHEGIVEEESFGRSGRPIVYVHLARKENSKIFYDITVRDTDNDEMYESLVEFDIFSSTREGINDRLDELIDICMKEFGVTKEVGEIVKDDKKIEDEIISNLKNELITRNPISNDLYDKLTEDKDRRILIELRKNSPVLESDIGDLSFGTVSRDKIKKTLDYFSGEEFGLVDRKKAIVCRENEEILFLMENEEEADDLEDLECPKCTNKIGNEKIISYYGRNEKLDDLLDGSRWMPLFVKEKFSEHGVDGENIVTEVKYEQDEIDVLVLFESNVFVIEVKDRSVNLNDAYKISAKTSRLESIFDDFVSREEIISFASVRPYNYSGGFNFVPMVISTEDISEDAIDLLEDTKRSAKYLDNCEGKVDSFVSDIVSSVINKRAYKMVKYLVSSNSDDSLSNFVTSVIHSSVGEEFGF